MNKYSLIASIVKLYVKTLRVHIEVNSCCFPNDPKIYAFWHGRMLLLPVIFRDYSDRIKVLISRHSDGEFAARLVKEFGFSAVRGSTGKGKGGVSATINMIKSIEEGYSIAIPVDGPKGPIHKVKRGISMLSIKTGVPVCPITFYCSNGKHLSSWDRFFIPYPFSKCTVKVGKPLFPGYNESDEEFRRRIEVALLSLAKELEGGKIWKT